MHNDSYRRTDECYDLQLNKHYVRQIVGSKLTEDEITELAKRMSTSTCAEYDEANRDGLIREDRIGRDLSDGSEVRSATCMPTKGGRLYFGNLKNKTGDLRARGFLPESNTLIRFYIPHNELPQYLDMNRNSGGTWGKWEKYIVSVEKIA